MTQNKAQKRAIRARMTKTGERYTTARHYHLDLHHARNGADLDASAPTEQAEAAEIAAVEQSSAVESASSVATSALPPRVAEPGVSDAAVLRATGKDWDTWFALLDAWGGTAHTHPEIARYVHETYGVDGWWAQNVTVGYERARGMRALHERPDGFSASASKTFPVPIERLFAAFMNDDERERWLDGIALRNRTNQPNKSARFDVLPGEGRLAVTFISKGAEKSVAQLQQERLPAAEDVDRWKSLWKEQLAHLATYLSQEAQSR
jgi:hypothetical protein